MNLLALVISLLMFVKQSVVLWVYGTQGNLPHNLLTYFAPSALTVVLWPWAFIILRDLRRRYRLS